MLNKRFKIAKCKTSLKLAMSRLKLMRNKKGVEINRMKKELAQLLESGQDRTARIRVEHVIREEKMVAAYDLIEIYCELIVARLPIIESQKTCPIDLKEAVTSVVFAAPRCSDITELVDVRKNFTAKYGKEFVSAALELRPDCGVSRMLVEKLSAVAPDLQTKMKVLSAVAKEHNISWNPTSFEEKESKPPDDLLNGPTNLEKATTMYVDPPKIQTLNVQNVHSHEGIPNAPLDFSQQNRRFTLDAQNITAADSGGIQLSASTTHDDTRPSGMAFGKQSFNSNSDDSWNMEFKDATSAAQAAAESAERASIAARAAAQLSSEGKITRQYSTESQKSHTREERSQVSTTSEYPGQGQFKYSYNASFNNRKPTMKNEHMGPSEKGTSPKATKGSSSLRSRNGSVDESSVNHFHQADGYFETHEDQGRSSPEMSSKTESRARFTSGDKAGSKFRPSRSHSSSAGDESDLFQQKVGKKTVLDQGNLSGTKMASPYGDTNRDDETDSDDDDPGRPRFDMGFEYDEGEAKSFFPSPGRETIHPLENSHISNPKRNPTKSVDLSHGPDSESETEKSHFSGTKKFTSPRKHGLFSTHPEPAYVEPSPKVNSRKSRIELNDLVESESESEMGKSSFSGTKKFASSGKHNLFSKHQVSADVESSPKVNSSKSRIELNDLVEKDSDFLNQSDDLYTREDLKFKTLTGGLRNNGRKYPPYTESASSSSKKSVEESTVEGNSTSKHGSFNSRASRLVNKKMNVSILSSESDSDEFRVQSLKSKSQFAPPDAFFNSDGTDSEEDIPKRTSSGKVHLGSGLSRRTKGQAEPKANTITSNQSPAEGRSYTENFRKNADSSTESKTSSISAERKSSTPFKQEAFRTMPEPKIFEPPPSPPKMTESAKTEEPKTLNPTSNSLPGKTNNIKKPSHVHPKLPDYDSLAARIQALQKTNYQ